MNVEEKLLAVVGAAWFTLVVAGLGGVLPLILGIVWAVWAGSVIAKTAPDPQHEFGQELEEQQVT